MLIVVEVMLKISKINPTQLTISSGTYRIIFLRLQR